MEKAILQTLIYAEIFKFPLKAWEIHKWLIGKKATLRQVEKALNKGEGLRVKSKDGYFFLAGKSSLIRTRELRKKSSEKYFTQAQFIAQFFKLIPFIKLVGISGSLAMENSENSDDLDFFVITSRNRLWISRLMMLFILEMMGKRRKREDQLNSVGGKGCLNLILDEDNLKQSKKDLFIAHEILQMKVLWERDLIYQKFIEENEWVFKFLPNWISSERFTNYNLAVKKKNHKSRIINLKSILDVLESLAKWLQVRYMGRPSGKEKILEGAVYFHPEDNRDKILSSYEKKLKTLVT